MTDWMIDPQLSTSLDAWRRSSRRAARRHARERAHDAMLDAIVAASGHRRPRGLFSLRPRFRHAGLIVATATIIGAASVAAAGWNAPPGSPLFVVRQARQGVMLNLPGADDVALHLEFAEQSLMALSERIDPAQSLIDARTELAEAYAGLSGDPSSPLWPRYHRDEVTLLADEFEFGPETSPPIPTHTPEPSDDDTLPGTSNPVQGGGGEDTPTSGATAHASPSPTHQDDGGGGGGDDGGSPSPGQSPPPDN